jgi:hypothetical protein
MTTTTIKFEPGDLVMYTPYEGCDESQLERGIVKAMCGDRDYVFVVYHCAEHWTNYWRYTGARTNINQLTQGWI